MVDEEIPKVNKLNLIIQQFYKYYIQLQEAYQLKDFLIETEKINKYDYETMIKDMDAKTRHYDFLKKQKKKWLDESKKYKENIEHMKEYQEEAYKKRNKELVEKLKKKENLLVTSLQNKQKSRMKERQKIIDLMMQKERLARESVERYMIKQEEDRQKLQVNSIGKSK